MRPSDLTACSPSQSALPPPHALRYSLPSEPYLNRALVWGRPGAKAAASGLLPHAVPAAGPATHHHAEACPRRSSDTDMCAPSSGARRQRSRPRARRRPTPTGCCGSGRRVPTLLRRAHPPYAPQPHSSAPLPPLPPLLPLRPCTPTAPCRPCGCTAYTLQLLARAPYEMWDTLTLTQPNSNPNPAAARAA